MTTAEEEVLEVGEDVGPPQEGFAPLIIRRQAPEEDEADVNLGVVLEPVSGRLAQNGRQRADKLLCGNKDTTGL